MPMGVATACNMPLALTVSCGRRCGLQVPATIGIGFRPLTGQPPKSKEGLAAPRSASSSSAIAAHASGQGAQVKKVAAVLFKGGEAAKNPEFLGCVENGLGLFDYCKEKGIDYVCTDDKEGPNCELEKLLPDIDVLITTPFHPAYMTKERVEKAKNLKLILTAGIGSDHIDLHAAADAGMTVAEVTGSNTTSVAEDEVMRILLLMRNFLPAWEQVTSGGWNVAEVTSRAYDIQGKTVGTLGSGRIGIEMMKRLKPFNCNLLYYARHELKDKEEQESIGCKWESDLDTFLGKCDVVSINLPLTDKTKGMINKEKISKMKKGAFLINNARGAIVNVDDVAEACKSGQLGGYSGDVWYPQPPPKDHPWRTMPNQAMTPHLSGATIDAQHRYAQGTKENLDNFINGKPLNEDNYIVRDGQLASQYM